MRKLFSVMILVLLIALVGCNGNEKDTAELAAETYNESDFAFDLLNINGDLVSITPDGKTMYTYFTGVG